MSGQAGRREGLLALLPYALGLAHLLVFAALFATVRGSFFGGDSGAYLAIAEALRSGHGAGLANAKPLGYPLLLALLSPWPGSPVAHAVILNSGAYLLTIAVIGRIVRSLGAGAREALVAQLVFVLVPNLASWSNLVLSDIVAMALWTASAWAFLCTVDDPSQRRYPIILGILLGAIGITRTEYLLALPVVGVVLAAMLWRRQSRARSVQLVALVWASSLPWLAVQPAWSGRAGSASLIPPNQSGFLDIWRSAYDLELDQLRFQRLSDLAERAATLPPERLPELRRNLEAFRELGPVETRVLDHLSTDLGMIQTLTGEQRRSLPQAYHSLAVRRLTEHPWRALGRGMRRFAAFLLAEDRDWPLHHPWHWINTLILQPVSVLGYLFALGLSLTTRGPPRHALAALLVWLMLPGLTHAAFVYEQRFIYPSVPMLCVFWGVAWWRFRTRGRLDEACEVSGESDALRAQRQDCGVRIEGLLS